MTATPEPRAAGGARRLVWTLPAAAILPRHRLVLDSVGRALRFDLILIYLRAPAWQRPLFTCNGRHPHRSLCTTQTQPSMC